MIEDITLTPDMISFHTKIKKISGRSVQPSVIEPSFGLGRIIYCLLEHAFYSRNDDENRGVLALKPIIAPYKVGVLTLVSDPAMISVVPRIVSLLTRNRISQKIDTSGVSIGRRYARIDELGCPFGITIDTITLDDDTVTLRERDTMTQVRVKIEEISPLLLELIDEEKTWTDVLKHYPNVQPTNDE